MTGVRWCLLARRARAIFDPSHGGSPETLCPAARRRSWAISVVAEEGQAGGPRNFQRQRIKKNSRSGGFTSQDARDRPGVATRVGVVGRPCAL